MEFKCLTNIETSFRQLRMYALVFAGVCAVVTVAAVCAKPQPVLLHPL